MVGDSTFLNKVFAEAQYVNGIHVNAVYTSKEERMVERLKSLMVNDYEHLLENVDAVYIRSLPELHYQQIKQALEQGKNVLCESPLTLKEEQTVELFSMAESKKLILMEAIKTAYATAFSRLLLLVKAGKIGKIISVDATCTSLKRDRTDWPGIYEWGPTALLPIFELLGSDLDARTVLFQTQEHADIFAKMDFISKDAVVCAKVGDGVKSEGELIISGTKGYAYVPAPWWKTDYFELRYEDQSENRRYFYQLDGEGIRYELVAFARAIERGKAISNIKFETTKKISKTMQKLIQRDNCTVIRG